MQTKRMTWMQSIPAVLWLGLFPLWNDGSYSHLTHGKWVGMLVLTAVTLLISVPCLFLSRKRPRLTLPQVLSFCYFGLLGLASLFGAYAGQLNEQGQYAVWAGAIRYEGMATQLCYFAVFFSVSLMDTDLDAVIRSASAGLLVMCVIIGLQCAGVNVFGLFPEGKSVYTNSNFQGTLGHVDMTSGYLSLMIPLLLSSFCLRRKQLPALIAGLAGTLLLFCIGVDAGAVALAVFCMMVLILAAVSIECRPGCFAVLSGMCLCLFMRKMILLPWCDGSDCIMLAPLSGMAAAVLIMGVLLAAGAVCASHHPGKTVKLKTAVFAAVGLMMIAVIVIAVLPMQKSSGALYEAHEILNGRIKDSFGNRRIGVWRHSAEMLKDHLISGNGADTFYYALRDHLAMEGETLSQTFDAPHNEYLAIWINGGLPALIVYLLLTGAAVRNGLRDRKLIPAAAAVICFAVQSIFSFSICLISPVFWTAMGIAASEKNTGDRE